MPTRCVPVIKKLCITIDIQQLYMKSSWVQMTWNYEIMKTIRSSSRARLHVQNHELIILCEKLAMHIYLLYVSLFKVTFHSNGDLFKKLLQHKIIKFPSFTVFLLGRFIWMTRTEGALWELITDRTEATKEIWDWTKWWKLQLFPSLLKRRRIPTDRN